MCVCVGQLSATPGELSEGDKDLRRRAEMTRTMGRQMMRKMMQSGTGVKWELNQTQVCYASATLKLQ